MQIVNSVIETSEKTAELAQRLKILYDEITLAIYTNVSRGLFERHKIVFSFMMNVAIDLNNRTIDYAQWNFLLRGPDHIATVYSMIYIGVLRGYNYAKIRYNSLNAWPKRWIRFSG